MKSEAEEIRLCKIALHLSVGPDIGILGAFSEAGRIRLNTAGLNAVVFKETGGLTKARFKNIVWFGPTSEELRDDWDAFAAAAVNAETVSIIFESTRGDTKVKDFAFQKLVSAGFTINAQIFDHSSYLTRDDECDLLLMTRNGGQSGGAKPSNDWRILEASIFRGHFTGVFVRPGDRVIQLGDEADFPVRASSPHGHFKSIDSLFALEGPPGSADFIAVGSALSLPDYMALAAKARKILTPGGRLAIVMKSHVLASGNPAIAIQSVLKPHLTVEKIFTQGEFRRYFHDVTSTENPDGDSFLVIAGTDPLSANEGVPFLDTIYRFPDPTVNLLAFNRDYSNPWLMRTFFGMSVRTENRSHRLEMARHLEATMPKSSADYGAALCVRGYDIAANGTREEKRAFIEHSQDYLSVEPSSPHAFRWKVSISFLCGTIYQGLGDFEDALAMFEQVMDSPWLSFSPTLGTKAGDAAYRSGMIAYLRGDIARARRYWARGVTVGTAILKSPTSELMGDPDCPLPDPLAEITDALVHVRGCADCLRVTDPTYGRASELQRREMITYDRRSELEYRLAAMSARAERSKLALEGARSRIAELEEQASWTIWSKILRRLFAIVSRQP
jgi:tetratricopeptide (TPR) repeat protein